MKFNVLRMEFERRLEAYLQTDEANLETLDCDLLSAF